MKFSGTHREGGEYAFDFYTELKHIAVPLADARHSEVWKSEHPQYPGIRVGQAVILSVADLEKSRHFYVDLLGLNVLHDDRTSLFLRGVEDREWSLKLELASEPGVRHIAYKVGSDART